MDGFDLFKVIPVDKISNVSVVEGKVVFLWLIQSQIQAGAASTGLKYDPDGHRLFMLLQEVFDFAACFFRYFKHTPSLDLLLLGTYNHAPGPKAVPADRMGIPEAVFLVRFGKVAAPAVDARGEIEVADPVAKGCVCLFIPDVR